MKRTSLTILGAAALLAILPAGRALATHVVNAVSGVVTRMVNNEIVVAGQMYRVSSDAVDQLQDIHVGEKVDLVLNGPADSSATEVVAIHARSNAR